MTGSAGQSSRGLTVHRAERTAELAAGLAGLLAVPPADPFTPDVVAVPTPGVERWLAQQLGHVLGTSGTGDGRQDGVCANVVFPGPQRLLAEVLATATGVAPAADPWLPDRTVWPLLAVIDEAVAEPWAAQLTRHVRAPDGSEPAPGRRLATAQKLARLFDGYAQARPALAVDWAAGRDTDGAGAALPADLQWQAELFRRLRARLGVPSPGERLQPAVERLLDEPGLVDLPARISLFGPTRVSAAGLAVLAALAEHRAVHLWLPHPSPALWQRLAELPAPRPTRRRDDRSADLVRQPVLAGLGRDVRELQLRLAVAAPGHADEHLPGPPRPGTLLGLLQRALHDDADPPASGGLTRLDPADRSVAVHACHGPGRQVEVLREVLVGLLADDPTLEPRDVLVMCPDIERYAPLVSAAFGLAPPEPGDDVAPRHPGHDLRVRLADRSLQRTNPVLGLVADLLELAGGRATASQVLDLAGLPPVRQRFELGDDDLARLREWVVATNIRWGFDAAHRAGFGLVDLPQNTWQAGLDRLLVGVAMADGVAPVGRAQPLDDVDSTDVLLAGRAAELVARLRHVLDRLSGPQPWPAWSAALLEAIDLLTDVPEPEAWQLATARRELGRVDEDARVDEASGRLLTLGDVRVLLADRLAGRPTRSSFRTGDLTMCSLMPMRSVPHRVVCVMGLDDGGFPRHAGVDGDDVLRRDPCLGERDPRAEDRQLLLDAVTAAGEHLVLLYTGADPRTNAPRPPAVPLGELLDGLDALATTAEGRPAREQVVVHHPLQPYHPRGFQPGRLGSGHRPFSFDAVALAGARRAAQPRHDASPFHLPAPLPAPPRSAPEVELADLVAFVVHPVQGFLRQRLGLAAVRDLPEVLDDLPLELTGLQRWQVGDRLLAARLAGVPPEAAWQAEWRRGLVPPGRLALDVLRPVVTEVEQLVEAVERRQGDGSASTVEVDLLVPGTDGPLRLVGQVTGVRGDVLVRPVFSRLGVRQRLRAWVELLALTASRPRTAWTAVSLGRSGSAGHPIRHSTLGPVEPGAAAVLLADLLRLRDEGLRAPLPLPVGAAAEYAEKRAGWVDLLVAEQDARHVFTKSDFAEHLDDAHVRVWGGSFDRILAAPAVGGDERTRFGELAVRLWQPLLDHEQAGPA